MGVIQGSGNGGKLVIQNRRIGIMPLSGIIDSKDIGTIGHLPLPVFIFLIGYGHVFHLDQNPFPRLPVGLVQSEYFHSWQSVPGTVDHQLDNTFNFRFSIIFGISTDKGDIITAGHCIIESINIYTSILSGAILDIKTVGSIRYFPCSGGNNSIYLD